MRTSARVGPRLAVAVVVVMIASTSRADRLKPLSYFGAVAQDSLQGTPAPRDESSGVCNLLEGKFETFAGVRVPVRVTKEPLWRLGFDEIRAVKIYEADPSPRLLGSDSYVFVRLEVSKRAGDRIAAARKPACVTSMIVRWGGRDLEHVFWPDSTSAALPGGAFESRGVAEHFYRAIADRISYVGLSKERRAYWQVQNERLVELMIWDASCDPAYLKGLGEGLYDVIMATPTLRQKVEQVDCKQGPPEIVPDRPPPR